MFETEEELQEKKERMFLWTVLIVGIIILVIGLVWGANKMYDAIKPLPQISQCESAGYDAGQIIGGSAFCYSNCENNKVTSCESRIRI